MKFANVVRNSAGDLPEAAELFTLYKQLKKQLKALPAAGGDAAGGAPPPPPAAELEAAFARAITADVARLNAQYMEREEDAVMRACDLEADAARAATRAERLAARAALADFHGELLLLQHWSILAYTGLVKILKKHQKRTGAPLLAPALRGLLQQPFCSTEAAAELAARVAARVAELSAALGAEGAEGAEPPALGAAPDLAALPSVDDADERGGGAAEAAPPRAGDKRKAGAGEPAAPPGGGDVVRRTKAALAVWQQLQDSASTPSTVGAAAGAAQQRQRCGAAAAGAAAAPSTGAARE